MRRLELCARVVAIAATVLALVAAASAIPTLAEVPRESLVAETWRVIGLGTWAALFALLAVRPGLAGLWVIATLSKAALAAAGIALGDAPGAGDLILWDGILAALLAIGSAASLAVRARRRQAAGS